MNVASSEFCRELHRLSLWENTDNRYVKTAGEEHKLPYVRAFPAMKAYETEVCPAYDLGFLLRKLPKTIDTGDAAYMLTVYAVKDYWVANYTHPRTDEFIFAKDDETPEDAGCKLAIELFKAGVLTKDMEQKTL